MKTWVFVTAVFTPRILTSETFRRYKKGLVICFYLTLNFFPPPLHHPFVPPLRHPRKTLAPNKTRRHVTRRLGRAKQDDGDNGSGDGDDGKTYKSSQ